jgi:hypothetical protein
MVERELKRAFDYFEVRLEKRAIRRVGSQPSKPSSLKEDPADEASSSMRDTYESTRDD